MVTTSIFQSGQKTWTNPWVRTIAWQWVYKRHLNVINNAKWRNNTSTFLSLTFNESRPGIGHSRSYTSNNVTVYKTAFVSVVWVMLSFYWDWLGQIDFTLYDKAAVCNAVVLDYTMLYSCFIMSKLRANSRSRCTNTIHHGLHNYGLQMALGKWKD